MHKPQPHQRLLATVRTALRRLGTMAKQVVERQAPVASASSVAIERNQLAAMIAASPSGIALMRGPDFIFETVNAQFLELVGPRPYLGRRWRDVYKELPDSPLPALMTEVFTTGTPFAANEMNIHVEMADNVIESRYYDFDYVRIVDAAGEPYGIFCQCTNVTQRVAARRALEASEAKLRRSEDRLSAAIATAEVGFYEWDIAGDNVTFSDQMQRDWGISAGTSLNEILLSIHPDDRAETQEKIAETLTNKTPYSTQYRVIRADGSIIWIEAQGRVFDSAQGVPARFFGTSINISERMLSQNKLEAGREQLQATIAELEKERELRERFVATLTHDMRTPLTAARLSAQLLTRKPRDHEYIKAIAARIIGSVDRAEHMVRDLLDANRLKAGEGIPITIKDCHLNHVVEQALNNMRVLSGDRFAVESTPVAIHGQWDCDAIQRVVENLVSNAVKYGDRETTISVTLDEDSTSVHLRVRNAGNIMQASELVAIFKNFHRTKMAVQSGQKGWGIGLTLVQGIAEAHGGTVGATSTVEEGTTFHVTLPRSTQKPIQERNANT